jgi:hypothetical protein
MRTKKTALGARDAEGQKRFPDETGHLLDQNADTCKAAGVVRADLTGDDCCTAGAVTLTARTPLLAMCRVLLANGFDPATPLQAFRGDTLCLMVRSIGMGAALTVAEHDPGSRRGDRFLPLRCRPGSRQIGGGHHERPRYHIRPHRKSFQR